MRIFESSDSANGNSGVEAISFRQVADLVGYSHTAIYRYFASKEVLINALKTRAFLWMRDETQRAIDLLHSPEQQLEALSRAYIQAAMGRPQRYALMFFNLDEANAIEHCPALRAAKEQALNVCIELVNTARDSGELASDVDPHTVAHMFWVTAHGLVSLQVADQFVFGKDIETLQTLLLNMLKANLRQPSAIHSKPKLVHVTLPNERLANVEPVLHRKETALEPQYQIPGKRVSGG